MPRLRTRTVSTKVTEDDYALFEQLAGDQRVGEWVREVLFKAVLSERTAEAHRTILGEVLALRKILLNLQFTVAAGEPVTRDRMLGLDRGSRRRQGRESAGAAHGRRRRVSRWSTVGGARRRRARGSARGPRGRSRRRSSPSSASSVSVSIGTAAGRRCSSSIFRRTSGARSSMPSASTKPGRYALLTVVDRRGPRLAVDADVEATPGSSSDAFTPDGGRQVGGDPRSCCHHRPL